MAEQKETWEGPPSWQGCCCYLCLRCCGSSGTPAACNPQTQNARRQVTATRTVFAGWRGYVATLLCLLLIFFDFILPAGILVR